MESKFILHKNLKVKTPFGESRIAYIHKTDFQEGFLVYTTNKKIKVSKEHKFIKLDPYEEVIARDLRPNDFLQTLDGFERVIKIEKIEDYFYDLTLENDNLYYGNGILCHNSGKTITIASYLTWVFCFQKFLNAGIVANRAMQAREFLKNIKDIFSRLPVWITPGISIWNKGGICNELETRIMTDVPTSNAFRGFTMNIVVVDECAFIKKTSWEEFADSIFPSQSALAWKKNIIISSANGKNHFYEMYKNNEKLSKVDDSYKAIIIDWKEVPRYDKNNNLISPEVFRDNIIKKYGEIYFEQNYGNSFIASSDTFIKAEVLNTFEPKLPIDEFSNVKIYEEPIKGHYYLIGCDTSKAVNDNSSISVIDASTLPFKQVAAFNEKINHMLIPNILNDLGFYYNTAKIIIENNDGSGQSVNDFLFNILEYPNLYFEVGKNYPGIRTTSGNRDKNLNFLKLLLNNKNLILNDAKTIDELSSFIFKNGKYQGEKDDAVLALMISVSILSDVKNVKDFNKFVEVMFKGKEMNSTDIFDIGVLMYDI